MCVREVKGQLVAAAALCKKIKKKEKTIGLHLYAKKKQKLTTKKKRGPNADREGASGQRGRNESKYCY